MKRGSLVSAHTITNYFLRIKKKFKKKKIAQMHATLKKRLLHLANANSIFLWGGRNVKKEDNK